MQNLSELAIQAAIVAGQRIVDIYDQGFDVSLKMDGSPLTEADEQANKLINTILAPTGIPIISEENKVIHFEERRQWARCWMIDPLDGTKEFIKRNGEFTVNIALIEEGKPKFGVIYVPVKKLLYVGNVCDKTAFKVVVDEHTSNISRILQNREPISPKKPDSRLLQVVGSRSHMNEHTLRYVDQLKEQGYDVEIVSRGSSLKFCLIAEGGAHMYPRFAPTMEWDTAAGHAICNAVGVKVSQTGSKSQLYYNKKDLVNPWFIVSSC